MRQRVAAWLGMDRPTLATFVARGASVATGVVTLVMIGLYLDASEQGYFFTFGSLIALQVLVELGLNQAIVQVASHEMAHLAWRPDGTVDGPAAPKRRLQSLLRHVLAWFAAAAVLMIVVLLPLGDALARIDTGPARESALIAWHWLVPLAAAALPVLAVISVLEGCNRIYDVALIRLGQTLAGAVALWLLLAGGHGVLALAAQAAVTLTVAVAGLAWRFGPFLRDIWKVARDLPGIHWSQEIWPFHWRIAVSWASGYLIAQLFNPLLFATHGPVAAGQMGLSLQLFGALNTLALTWATAQVPRYGQMVVHREGQALDRLFMAMLRRSSIALALALVALMSALLWLDARHPALAGRVLPLHLMLVLCGVCLANHVVFCEAALLRAHRQEPFMGVSVATGLATALLAWFWIPPYGTAGAVAASAVAALGVALGGGTWVFLGCRRRWWLAADSAA